VLGGKDARLPLKLDRDATKRVRDATSDRKQKVYRRDHTSSRVHRTMLWQICRDYSTLPDPRTLTITEIVFWYAGLRADLYERTRPRKKT
jgi:hypothetical protein